ncbi:MAG: hypothetical protein R8M71_04060 [Alphaproteobacteria bacterium]|nr:hypothetical protein [Alphaproteobacteria bacterium]
MKRLIVVLSGLLVLPAFADITPISSGTTNTPVAQPSRAVPRGSATANRATSRVTPSTTSGVSARDVSTRNSQSSRNATTARTGVQTVERSATGNIGRVASRPSRNVGEMTENTVTTRRAMPANTNPGVTARVGMTTPMVANRVSSRSSAAIQARAPTTISVSAAAPIMIEDEEEQIITTTEEKQTAISNMDEIVQMTDYCKSQYTACMDNFCNVLDDNQGRCSCSKNIKNYEKTENALKAATEALQDVSQQIQYIGLTKDDIETLFSQTEAEIAMQSTTDSTQLKNDLDNIKDMIVGIKTGTASSSETGVSFDLSGLMDFNIDSTGFDLTALFAGNNANTTSISNQRGEQLYKTAQARCKTAVLNTCQAQGVDVSIITNSYDLEIDKQCIAYERSLTESNENMNRTVRNAKAVLQKARLMVAQQKNAYDLRGCVNALDSCMQDDFVCGTDYENCLDPSGKYIVNGEVVIGSTPGYVIEDDTKSLEPAPVQHKTGLYATWTYKDGSEDNNAWLANGSLIDYISAHIQDKEVTETSETLIPYLQYKIGYIKDNKAYGMCSSVLNKCQNYTYDKKKYKHDNQVIREYLQRTLTQIKVAQDEIINSYAENCISDVNSCLSSNNYTAQANYAINACKSQIVTCMSVNGDSTANPTPENVKQWVYAIQNPTEIKSLTFDANGLSIGWLAAAADKYTNQVYNPAIKLQLPTSSETLARSSQVTGVGDKQINSGKYCMDDVTTDKRYWCYEKFKEVTDSSSSSEPQTELVCVSLTSSGNFIPAGTKLVNGTITLSCNSKCITQNSTATCP